jgi:ABC-type sugar transport system substrate-binding protein
VYPRSIAAALAAAAALSLATGCSAFDRAFGKQEIVVVFKNATPAQVMLKVRAACSHIPAATPEPIPPHPLAIQLPDDIRYVVSNASDAQVARLEQCLNRFPSVVGVNPVSPDGS